MRQMEIGRSGIFSSPIGIGCMRIAEMSEAEVAALVERSLALGIQLFDHADIYGGGESERLFGAWLAKNPAKRSSLVLQSKCGIRQGWYDLSKEHILTSTEAILRRLQTEYLDVLMLHRPDTLMEPEEIAEAFAALHAAGKVRAFGVSNMNPVQIELLRAAVPMPLAVNQMQFSAAHSGLVDSGIQANVRSEKGEARDAGVLEYCRAQRITLQAWSPLQYGFFAGTFLGSELYAPLNAELDRLAAQYGCAPAAIAVAWILRHPAGIQAILGSTNTDRLAQMARATEITLTREEWYAIYRAAGNMLP